jgi:hypothetical protein
MEATRGHPEFDPCRRRLGLGSRPCYNRPAWKIREESIDRFTQKFPRNWFEQIFVSASFQCTRPIHGVISARHDDDLCWLELLANGATNLKAVGFWHE